MTSAAPILSFLRPLALPRPSTVRQFLRFSTGTPCRAAEAQRSKPPQQRKTPQQREDRNLIASRKVPEVYPPPSFKSLPRPKESRASRRTAHPPKQRNYPTRAPTHHPTAQRKLIPEPVESLAPEKCAPNLSYFVTRSANDELPIYTMYKRGRSLKQTKVKRIDGNKFVLRDELREHLGVGPKDAVLNSVTGHLIFKGHWKPEIETFLRQRQF